MIRYELCHEKPYFFCMLTMKMLISLHIHAVAKNLIRASIVHSLVCTVPQSSLYIQNWLTINEPRHEKILIFPYAKTKTQISFVVTVKLISAFVFATRIVQSLFYLNPKSQDSSHLLWLYSPVCVGPGRKPRRPVFSQRGSNVVSLCQSKMKNNPY